MTEQHREEAVRVLKKLLHVLHQKRYEDLPHCVDKMDWDTPGQIRECVQGTLDLNGFGAFDEYGVPSRFHPPYEYHQISFSPYNDGSGFAVDDNLTAGGGEMTDLRLQLEFISRDGGLKRIVHTIDPMCGMCLENLL